MLIDKIKSIINSCVTDLQLDTCLQWLDLVAPNYADTKELIETKRSQIHRVQSKQFTPEEIADLQRSEH